MINLKNGWAQWDYQLGTFRAEIDGVIHGVYTGQYLTANALATKISLSLAQISELNLEKTVLQEKLTLEAQR